MAAAAKGDSGREAPLRDGRLIGLERPPLLRIGNPAELS